MFRYFKKRKYLYTLAHNRFFKGKFHENDLILSHHLSSQMLVLFLLKGGLSLLKCRLQFPLLSFQTFPLSLDLVNAATTFADLDSI